MSSKTRFDIVAVGSVVREMVAWVDRYPGAGDGIYTHKVVWTGGGMAGNFVHAVARLGGKTALACAIGDDPLGDQIAEQLAQAGANTNYLVRRPNTASPLTILMITPDLKRAGLVTELPGNLRLQPEELPDDLLPATRLFFTDMEPAAAAIAAARQAKESGVPVAFDMQLSLQHTNLPGHSQNIETMFNLADYYFADEENLLFWRKQPTLDKALAQLLAQRPKTTFVITRGIRGSLVATATKQIQIPAFETEVVDSIGAGDAYHAAFLYTHAILGQDLKTAGLFGSAAAALSCQQAGARDGLPTMDQVNTFLANQRG